MQSEYKKIDLTTFFLSIASAAFMGLGKVPMEESGASRVDIDMARQNIDLLELLRDKTQGNRTKQEDELLEQLLAEIRLCFVEVKKELDSLSLKS